MRTRSFLAFILYALVYVLAPGAHHLLGEFEDACTALSYGERGSASDAHGGCCDHGTVPHAGETEPDDGHDHEHERGHHHCLEHCALCQLAWIPQRHAADAVLLTAFVPVVQTTHATPRALPGAVVCDAHSPRGPPAFESAAS